MRKKKEARRDEFQPEARRRVVAKRGQKRIRDHTILASVNKKRGKDHLGGGATE